jgi:hypothetical protein
VLTMLQCALQTILGSFDATRLRPGPVTTADSQPVSCWHHHILVHHTALVCPRSAWPALCPHPYAGAIILVNAAPSQEELGTVNGVGQTVAALVRGVGPAMGGILWAASLELKFDGHQFFTFVVVALVAIGGWLLFGRVQVKGIK